MKCPVCKSATGIYYEPPGQIPDELVNLVRTGRLDPAKLATVPREMPLYQKSYEGEPEYVSPRCRQCFDKAIKMIGKRKIKKEERKSASTGDLSHEHF